MTNKISTNTQHFSFEQLQDPQSDIGTYTHYFFTPNGLALMGALAVYLLMRVVLGDRSSKKKIASSYWGGAKEIAAADKKAKKQIKNPKCDSAAFYIGQYNFKGTKKDTGKRFHIPDIQRGTAAIGSTGSGKSASIIDPALLSAVDQGFPIILYDFKYPTQAKIAAYAKSQGYDVHIFAPGFPESEVCNPLDFLEDAEDAETAKQLSIVLNKNFSLLSKSNSDGFFAPSGEQLTQAILMLTKEFGEYADIITSAKILSSERMIDRLMAASLNPWVRDTFGQLFSSANSEKTVAGITATASLMFSRFIAKKTLGCFVGKTTLPLDIKGKQMIIFGLDRARRDAVSPLIASIIHMIIARNIAKKREDPLVVSIDELPSLYLPELVRWLNESRSDGFCALLGWQNMSQLEGIYGKEVARTILSACNTKFIFNPGENDSAQLFSSFLGDEQIKFTQKSRSTGGGKPSTTTSEQEKTRKLFEPAQFLKLPPGKCVFFNPAYSNKNEGSVPLLKSIKLPPSLNEIYNYNQNQWGKLVKQAALRSTQKRLTVEDLDIRIQQVDRKLPIPQDPVEPGAQALPVDGVKSIL